MIHNITIQCLKCMGMLIILQKFRIDMYQIQQDL
nr:MAG TPA: hypothetical protein [Caudoviricetes sp.]